MYSVELKEAIKNVAEKAKEMSIPHYSLDMFVLEIINNDKKVQQILEEKNINVEELKTALFEQISSFAKENHSDDFDENDDDAISGDIWVLDVISRVTLDHSLTKQSEEIDGCHILAAVTFSDMSPTAKLFNEFNISRQLFIDYVFNDSNSEEFDDYDDVADVDDFENETSYPEDQSLSKKEKKMISEMLFDLTKMAKAGEISPVIGRNEEVKRIETILTRKTKNNPVLTGLSGVGKTALVNGLAFKMINGEVDEDLSNKKLYSLNIASLVAGSKYRGQFEQKLLFVVNKLRKEKAILFVDEIHTMLGAGRAEGGNDAANILKPYLSSGQITIIGATTEKEYAEIFEKDPSLSRRFNQVNIKSLSSNDTVTLLKEVKHSYEEHHHVSIDDKALNEIVSLSNRYIQNRQFPDKALDLLDETCAIVKLDKENVKNIVSNDDVFKVVSNMTSIPVSSMKDNDGNQAILGLKDELESNVFGQENAVNAVSEAMMLSYAGLKPDNKPMGSFLFLGPTGVGKTELAKTLKNKLNMNLVRFDMGEFMESQTISKLIGSPSGYVGSEEQSLLSKELSNNPYSVVLFDEFEKAHPTIKNLLLSVLDEGYVKDSKGNLINFKNTIIIFTSNIGVVTSNQGKHGMGFNSVHKETKIDMDLVKKAFAPEWRNRLTAVVEFNPLNEDVTSQIANKAIQGISDLIEMNRGIKLKWTKAVSDFIAKEGFDKAMGARPIERKAFELISKPLAKLTLTESLEKGTVVKIKKSKNDIILEVETKK